MESTPSSGLAMRWVPVADESGRIRMEVVWVTEATPVEAPVTASHAA